MGGFTDFVKDVSGVSLFEDLSGATAAREAGRLGAAAATEGLAETGRQFDITQENLRPFLEAATGARLPAGFTQEEAQKLIDLRSSNQFPDLAGITDADLRAIRRQRGFTGRRGQRGLQRMADEFAARGIDISQVPDDPSNDRAITALGDFEQSLRGRGFDTDDFNQAIETIQAPQQGALQQFREGIEGAPSIPQLEQFLGRPPTAPEIAQFTGQAVDAPTLRQQGAVPELQQFGGQVVGAPELERFQFDPQKALESPALQFQREQGEIALDRLSGKNRQLGSGQRLIEAQKFGQGIAAQSLGDEFQRQLTGTQQRNQAAQQQFGIGSQQLGQEANINQIANSLIQQGLANDQNALQMANQIAGQQFGLGSQQLGQQIGLNQLQNQQGVQQFGLAGQQFGTEQQLAQQEQNRQLTQFGLGQDAFNQRLNRLAGLVDVGRGTAGTLAQAGQQQGNTTANLLQARASAQGAGQIGSAQANLGLGSQILGGLALGGAFSGGAAGGGAIPAGGISESQFVNNPFF